MAESIRLNGQELVNRMDYLPIGFGMDSYGFMPGIGDPAPYPSGPNDRHNGADWPGITSALDVDNARALARYITTVNCPALGIRENLTNYVIGKGFQFSAATKRTADAPEGLVECVQDVIDEFLDANDFVGDLDRELFWRSRRDGEFFLALYPDRSGITQCRIIEPEQIVQPAGAPFSEAELSRRYGVKVDVATNWDFGVHKADHDVQTVFGYHVQWSTGQMSDYLPASRCEHHRSNVDRNVARGLTDFFPAWKWLEQQARLLQNTGEGAAELAAISYIVQHVEGVTQQQILSMRSANADYTVSMSTPNGTKNIYREHKLPGSKLDVPRGQEYLPGPMGAERGQAFLEVVQGILRQVATRWCLSEGMISGNDQNANYASSIVAGSRFHRYAVASQARIARSFYRIVWRALENAYAAGRFSRFSMPWAQFEKLVEVNIEPPDVDEKKSLEQAQEREILFRNGVLSRETWAAKSGLDAEQEAQHMVEARAKTAAESMQRVRSLITENYP